MQGRRTVGPIPPAEWPRIQSRYLAGDSLAKIARDYGCTVRLIQTILKKKAEAAHSASGAEARVAFRGQAFDGNGARGGYQLDAGLRSRVTDTMVAFLSSFDHVLSGYTQKDLQNLRGATEHLLRAAARVRLALELASRKNGR